jgi:hypothetical protein
LVYEGLNVILAIVGLAISITVPFIIRAFTKKDKSVDIFAEKNDRMHDEITRRLDRYEERLRMAEMEIIRNTNTINRVKNGNNVKP